ncbi:MAG: hypothetical protein UW65_C0028G0005 [candidate division WWE3 bacterium GW2011_GWB1_44_4]|uniref:Uncharacterized protein n=2 Tax=Katanobacteria TaxID=422282 RepID=A0A0G1KLE5_UNCKA|nr:MAG: hypothetical protein UW65_C0028G0005 [candidate division WWE3 bacterium GW2011_GWB1_44_4]KKT84526.1 MAG: hypothetical protein UW82_C0018G0004 [candidate division WWE3 bacterium GW2011_GWC2_44_9]
MLDTKRPRIYSKYVRKVIIITASLFVLISFISTAHAAESVPASESIAMPNYKILPPGPSDPTALTIPFFGQDHNYSVTFRGNGLAVVFLRAAFYNAGDTPLKELTLRFPAKIQPEGIAAYQIVRDNVCKTYDYTKYNQPTGQYACLTYTEPNYYDYYYGANTYKKAQVALANDTLTVTIPSGIASQKTGSALVYYRAFGYAKKNSFGAYPYTFETVKVDDTIRALRVGISTDSDLVMKGVIGGVDYFRETAPLMESTKVMSFGSSFTNTSIDTSLQSIGYGAVNKEAYNLMPLDAYTVAGAYAKNPVALYAKELVIGVATVLVLLVLVVFAGVKIYKVAHRVKTSGVEGSTKGHVGLNIAISALSGFLSSFAGSVFIVLAYFVLQLVSSWTYSGDILSIMHIFAVLVIIGLAALVMLPPHFIVGAKRGMWWGFASFVFMLFWFLFNLLVLGLIYATVKYNPPFYPDNPIVY